MRKPGRNRFVVAAASHNVAVEKRLSDVMRRVLAYEIRGATALSRSEPHRRRPESPRMLRLQGDLPETGDYNRYLREIESNGTHASTRHLRRPYIHLLRTVLTPEQ